MISNCTCLGLQDSKTWRAAFEKPSNHLTIFCLLLFHQTFVLSQLPNLLQPNQSTESFSFYALFSFEIFTKAEANHLNACCIRNNYVFFSSNFKDSWNTNTLISTVFLLRMFLCPLIKPNKLLLFH